MRIIFPLKSKPHSNPRRIAEILGFSQPFQTLFLNQFFYIFIFIYQSTFISILVLIETLS